MHRKLLPACIISLLLKEGTREDCTKSRADQNARCLREHAQYQEQTCKENVFHCSLLIPDYYPVDGQKSEQCHQTVIVDFYTEREEYRTERSKHSQEHCHLCRDLKFDQDLIDHKYAEECKHHIELLDYLIAYELRHAQLLCNPFDKRTENIEYRRVIELLRVIKRIHGDRRQ